MVLPDCRRDVRAAVTREDARVVNHLAAQRDDARPLRDLEVALIAGADVRRAIADATRTQRQVLRTIGWPSGFLGRGLFAGALGRAGRWSRNAAVRRIDDERGAVVPHAVGQPRLVVVAHLRVAGAELGLAVDRGRDELVGKERVAAVHHPGRALLQVRELGVGHRGAQAELLRPLERRHAVVGPHALEVGMTVRHPRHGPRFARLATDDEVAERTRPARIHVTIRRGMAVSSGAAPFTACCVIGSTAAAAPSFPAEGADRRRSS